MASETSGRRSVRLPPEQQKELEKDGRIKRFFCDVLRLRVLSYITAQPAAFIFILTLFLIAASMPPISWYIKTHDSLPDLYTMKIWNSYLGKLAETSFCINDAADLSVKHLDNCSNTPNAMELYGTVGVSLDFVVNSDKLPEKLPDEKLPEDDTVHLRARLTGKDLKTKIRSHNNFTHRLDSDITVHIHLQVDKKHCNHTCHVNACVSITAPLEAQPVRMPHILEDYTFNTTVFHGARHPKDGCKCSAFTHESKKNVLHLDKCKENSVVKPAGEKFRHHGLIVVWLEQDDREAASFRIMLAALAVAAIAIAFAAAIACTDRPTQPKNSTE